MGEFELIRRFFIRSAEPREALLGPGDDCALLGALTTASARFAVTTDLLVDGVHFFSDVDPQTLGHKALAVNLSDLAAMGARPFAYLLALVLPRVDEAWLAAFSRGMHRLADLHGIELVGGDTTQGPLTIGITALGEVDPAVALRRDRARPGDDLWVSGSLGAAAYAVRERRVGQALPAGHPARTRLELPTPRVALGLALAELAAQGMVHAAIDLSDGLAGDLGHLLDRSGAAIGGPLGAVLWSDALPFDTSLSDLDPADRTGLMLRGGDDYELAFTAPVHAREALERLGAGPGMVDLHRIGTLDVRPGLRLQNGEGVEQCLPGRAFQHFSGAVV